MPSQILRTHALLRSVDQDQQELVEVPADFVLLMTGYRPDQTLMEQLGIRLEGEQRSPACDRDTMETNIPGVYVAGTATAGEQLRFRLFIENCHIHAKRIAHALAGKKPPPDENPWGLAES